MSNPENTGGATPDTRPSRLMRSAALGGAILLGIFDVFALNVGALDDVPTFIKTGGAAAIEKVPFTGHAVTLAEHTAFDVTCQLSATEVVGATEQGTTYGVNPEFLLPASPVDRTADWTTKLHDCSQPVQYNTTSPTP